MIVIFAFSLGAFMNRVRGGFLTDLCERRGVSPAYLRIIKTVSKISNDLVFGLMITAARYDGLMVWDFVGIHWLFFALASVAMLLGRMLGWGEYIGAMIRGRVNDAPEVALIDSLIFGFRDRPTLWGFLGLTLRGIMWGLSIAIFTHTLLPVVAGAFMGVAYYVAIVAAGRFSKSGMDAGWPWGETLFGGLLWAVCAYSM